MARTIPVRAAICLLGILGLAAGCAAPGPGDEDLGQTAEAIAGSACVLTTYDGYNIFRSGSCSDGTYFNTLDGNTYSSSGVRTGYEWQCVEWTNRYFHFKWGTRLPWFGNATDKCTNHPSTVSTVSSPWWGDAVVFRPNACLRVSSGSCVSRADPTYGHIGIVAAFPSATTMRVRDQNAAQHSYNDYLRAAVGSYPNPVQCYLRDSHHVCQAGSTQACTVSACTGTQTCAADGRSWESCVCPDGGVPDASADSSTEVVSDASSDVLDDSASDSSVNDAARVDVANNDASHDGSRGDVSPDAGGEASNVLPGCGCAVPGHSAPPRTLAGAVMLGALLLARRRARR